MTERHHILSGQADALSDPDFDADGFLVDGDGDDPGLPALYDGDQLEREERAALRRVAGLSTELTDVSEVEYRRLRLERVVLVGVWTEGTVEDAENSLVELAELAKTAGSVVLAGLIQRRDRPDPAHRERQADGGEQQDAAPQGDTRARRGAERDDQHHRRVRGGGQRVHRDQVAPAQPASQQPRTR